LAFHCQPTSEASRVFKAAVEFTIPTVNPSVSKLNKSFSDVLPDVVVSALARFGVKPFNLPLELSTKK